MDGVVLEAGPASGFGLAVYIQHENGDVTVYGHMDEILVQAGQVVRAGDTIALLGNRGQSTGPHLHFEVHVGGLDGQKIDPLPVAAGHGHRHLIPPLRRRRPLRSAPAGGVVVCGRLLASGRRNGRGAAAWGTATRHAPADRRGGPAAPPGRRPRSHAGRPGRPRSSAPPLTGSLALLADAGHMATDAAGIALALGAVTLAQRPAARTAHLRLAAAGDPRRGRQRAAAASRVAGFVLVRGGPADRETRRRSSPARCS